MTSNAPPPRSDEDELDLVLDQVLAPWRGGPDDVGVLFSGGVDSSLLAWELRNAPGLRLFTVGTRESRDLAAADAGARLLGLPWTGSVVTAVEVRRMAREIGDELQGLGPVDRSVQTAFALAMEHAAPVRLACGQGADELFLGYAHYRGLAPEAAGLRSETDLKKLLERDWPRTRRIAQRLGRSVAAPYLDERFVAAARRIPVDERVPAPVPKSWFRTWARHRGLPESLASRPKRALQFGTGVDRILRSSV